MKDKRDQFRGMERRRIRKEKDLIRSALEVLKMENLLKSRISLFSIFGAHPEKPVSSIFVYFRFEKPISPNDFYNVLEDKLEGII